jgi:hypothetical protein
MFIDYMYTAYAGKEREVDANYIRTGKGLQYLPNKATPESLLSLFFSSGNSSRKIAVFLPSFYALLSLTPISPPLHFLPALLSFVRVLLHQSVELPPLFLPGA